MEMIAVTGWQLQEAKQRFSEVIRRASDEGPQIVTRHGEDVAVVLDIKEYRRLKGDIPDFNEFLLAGPDLNELEIVRSQDLPRPVELGD
ncbi:type II toxin-antitoxin system Phd/YefM family antitoxin [Thermopolyspora sp. NPDC052614]|uniref:type II toxin-antitoxin system Phd/YefM family antitoxin n=1 Tax=Thermopolyspora sp. NPDC052614 TaxID=3155682 RepID=UPI003412984D